MNLTKKIQNYATKNVILPLTVLAALATGYQGQSQTNNTAHTKVVSTGTSDENGKMNIITADFNQRERDLKIVSYYLQNKENQRLNLLEVDKNLILGKNSQITATIGDISSDGKGEEYILGVLNPFKNSYQLSIYKRNAWDKMKLSRNIFANLSIPDNSDVRLKTIDVPNNNGFKDLKVSVIMKNDMNKDYKIVTYTFESHNGTLYNTPTRNFKFLD